MRRVQTSRHSRFRKQRKSKRALVTFNASKIEQLKTLQKQELERAQKSGFNWEKNPFISLALDQARKAGVSEQVLRGLKLFCYRILSRPEDNLVNATSTIRLPEPLKIDHLISKISERSLDYRRYLKFSGVPVRFRIADKECPLKFTSCFFKSGKINLVGLTSLSEEHLERIAQVLRAHKALLQGKNKKLLGSLKGSDIVPMNRVYSGKLPFMAALKNLDPFNALEWRQVKYNDQAFPGGVYVPFLKASKQIPLYVEKEEEHQLLENYKRNHDMKNVKIIFFKTGSCIFVGLRREEYLAPVMCKFILLMVKYHSLKKHV